MSSRMDVHKMTQTAVFLEVKDIVNHLWPTATVRLYGSCVTQLALPFSDVDIVIQLQSHYPIYYNHHQFAYQINENKSIRPPDHQNLHRFQCYQPLESTACVPQSFETSHRFQSTGAVVAAAVEDRIEECDFSSSGYGDDERASVSERTQSPASCSSGGVTTTVSSSISDMVFPTAVRESVDLISAAQGPLEMEIWEDYKEGMSTRTDSPNNPIEYTSSTGAQSGVTGQTSFVSSDDGGLRLGASHAGCSSERNVHYEASMSANQTTIQYQALTRQDVVSGLYALTNVLYQRPWAQQVNPIATAAVPVIKFSVASEIILQSAEMRAAVTQAYFQHEFMSSSSLTEMASPLPTNNHSITQDGPQDGPQVRLTITREEDVTPIPELKVPHNSSSNSSNNNDNIGPCNGVNDDRNFDYSNSLPQISINNTPHSNFRHSSMHMNPLPPSHPHSQHSVVSNLEAMVSPAAVAVAAAVNTWPLTPTSLRRFPVHTQPPPQQQPPQQQQQQQQQQPLGMLPFHLAAGVSIPVDLSVEAGEHRGILTSNYILEALKSRPYVVPSVIKVGRVELLIVLQL